jgi:hypothetical protein
VTILGTVALRDHPAREVEPAYPIPSRDHRIVVEVLNGTARPGLARAGTRLLRRRGVDVVFFGNADAPAESTRVISRRGDPELAGRVIRALGVGVAETEADSLRRVDVTVILGEDFRAPDELHP